MDTLLIRISNTEKNLFTVKVRTRNMCDFFLLGGTKNYKFPRPEKRACPRCGFKLKRKRVQNCCCLFFIPIFPVSRGHDITKCHNCGWSAIA